MPDLTQYDPTIEAASQEWNVDPNLVRSVMGQESSGNPKAVSPKGAQGLMQIMPATGQALGATDLSDPVQNIYAGAKMLSQGLDKEGSPEGALLYYHGGPDWRNNYGPESAGYVPGVTQKYAAISKKYPPAASAAPAQEAAVPKDAFDSLMSAPPPATPAPAAPAAAPDPFDALMATPAAPAAPPAAAPAYAVVAPHPAPDGSGAATNLSDADYSKFTAPQAAQPAVLQVPAPASPATPAPVSAGDAAAQRMLARIQPDAQTEAIGPGIQRGVRDLLDRPAEWLASGLGAPGAGNALQAKDAADQAAFSQQYAGNGGATLGRIGGNMLAAAPVAAGANALMAVAPVVGPWLAGTAGAGASGLGGLAARVGSNALNGSLIGAGAGAVGPGDQPLAARALSGVETGGAMGAGASTLGNAGSGVWNAVTGEGGGVSPAIAELAKTAIGKYGIPITAPQMSNNTLLRAANEQSAALPFSGAHDVGPNQQAAWTQAVSREMGENNSEITPDVMHAAAQRIGGVFNGVANRTNIAADPQLNQDFNRIQTEMGQVLPADQQSPIIKQMDNVRELATNGGGSINGAAYQSLTRANAPLGRLEQSQDPNMSHYAGQLREALDDAFQRSASPADQQALTQARQQYRAMKTIQPLVEKSADGGLSPALLMGRVQAASSRFDPSTGGMAYTGGGNLGELARIGKQFIGPQPNSTTADRMMVNTLMTGGAGGAAAAYLANPLYAAGIPAGLVANRLGGAYLRSGGYANRMIDSSLNPPTAGFNPLSNAYAVPAGALQNKRLNSGTP